MRYLNLSILMCCLIGFTSPNLTRLEEQRQNIANKSDQNPFIGVDVFDFYSAFMSEASAQECTQIKALCEDDPIPPQLWLETLSSAVFPVTINTPNSVADYELLVASQLRKPPKEMSSNHLLSNFFSTQKPIQLASLHTEFTLQWRGFPLNTYSTSTALSTEEEFSKSAKEIVSRWKNHVLTMGLFSRDFLYSSLQASDYRNGLTLVSYAGDFFLEDTQLHPDPFLGAVARYRHPMYSDAILDIAISPIREKLTNINDNWLNNKIKSEFEQAQEVTESRELTLFIDKSITEITFPSVKGMYFSIHASNDIDEPLYAATYVFIVKDKLVKFTSSFPYHIAEPLVRHIIVTLDVPAESKMMEQVREFL